MEYAELDSCTISQQPPVGRRWTSFFVDCVVIGSILVVVDAELMLWCGFFFQLSPRDRDQENSDTPSDDYEIV